MYMDKGKFTIYINIKCLFLFMLLNEGRPLLCLLLNIKLNLEIVWIHFILDNNTIGYMKGNTAENNFKEKIADFLAENIWMIIGVSSVFVFVIFSCIGTLLFCKKW